MNDRPGPDPDIIAIPSGEKDPKTNLPVIRTYRKSLMNHGAYDGNNTLLFCPFCNELYPAHKPGVDHVQGPAYQAYLRKAEMNVTENARIAFTTYPNIIESKCHFKCPNHESIDFVVSIKGRAFCGHCLLEALEEKLGIPIIGNFSQRFSGADFENLPAPDNKEEDHKGLRVSKLDEIIEKMDNESKNNEEGGL